MREQVGYGWAVRIQPSSTSTGWLNEGGGYVATRSGRATWKDYEDALEASRRWGMCKPVIVRVLFFANAAPQRKAGARR